MNEHKRLRRMFDEAKGALKSLADEARATGNTYILTQVNEIIDDLDEIARFSSEEP